MWVNVPGTGYVGVGRVTEKRHLVIVFEVDTKTGRKPVLDVLTETEELSRHADDPEKAEYFVRVQWLDTKPESEAVQEVGFFGNQNTVCRPKTPKWAQTVEQFKNTLSELAGVAWAHGDSLIHHRSRQDHRIKTRHRVRPKTCRAGGLSIARHSAVRRLARPELDPAFYGRIWPRGEQMSTSEALAAWKLFLETTPPNTSVKIQGLAEASQHVHGRWQFETPQIQLHCEHDGPYIPD